MKEVTGHTGWVIYLTRAPWRHLLLEIWAWPVHGKLAPRIMWGARLPRTPLGLVGWWSPNLRTKRVTGHKNRDSWHGSEKEGMHVRGICLPSPSWAPQSIPCGGEWVSLAHSYHLAEMLWGTIQIEWIIESSPWWQQPTSGPGEQLIASY